jgi:hypothetical protein
MAATRAARKVPVFDLGTLDFQINYYDFKSLFGESEEIFRTFRRTIFCVLNDTITVHYHSKIYFDLFGVDHLNNICFLAGEIIIYFLPKSKTGHRSLPCTVYI